MIEMTERQSAQKRIESIKTALEESQVDYYLCETPYKLSINLKKKLLRDYSPKLMSPISCSTTQDNSFTALDSTISQSIFSNTSSPVSSLGDSGILSKCSSCENSEKKTNDTQKQLIGNILESNKTKEDLRKVITTKDDFIKQLENKLKKSEGDKNRFKAERDTKHEQLKIKNKSFENELSKYQKETEKNASIISNLRNKTENLENSVKTLNSKLCEKNELLKQERANLKKSEKKKKTKTKSTETDQQLMKNVLKSSSTQTAKKEMKNIETDMSKHQNQQHEETLTEEKYFLILKDRIASDIFFKTTQHTAIMRNRSNSFPSSTKVNVVMSSKGVGTKQQNPNEAPWDAIDPDVNVEAASALYLTRDIAGFFCAMASNMGRYDLIEDMIEEMTEHIVNIT